jgi:hypothetical protein
MTKNPRILERIKEVQTALLDQQPRKSIIETFGKKWEVGSKAIDVYISEAKKLIKADAGEISKKESEHVTQQILKNGYRKLSIAKKLDILYQIATGKAKVPIMDKGKKVWKWPTMEDRIKAIQLENEMTGEGYNPPPVGNQPQHVSNQLQRVIVFKTNRTTAAPQTFETENPD